MGDLEALDSRECEVSENQTPEEPAGAPGAECGTERGAGAGRRHRQERKTRHAGGGGRRGAHHLAAKFRMCRKRSHTFNTATKFFLPHKRPRKDAFIPPTKFLLGGNISDPLNLNSLQDEDINRAMNAVTPKSSPLPTPPRHKAKVDVIIPPDVRDPLNLMHALSDDEYEKRLETQPPRARRPRRRPRLRRRTSESTAETSPAPPAPPAPGPLPAGLQLESRKRSASESEAVSTSKPKENKKPRRMDSMDKIVSPVVPQPGAWMRARPPRDRVTATPVPPTVERPLPKFHPKNERYQYGNYDRYYGYRNAPGAPDVRLEVLTQYRHLFLNKDVLDVGCNVGYMSIEAARSLGARSVTGIDIDPALIARAQRNLLAFTTVPSEAGEPGTSSGSASTAQAAAPASTSTAPAAASTSTAPAATAPAARGKRRKKNRKAAHQFYFPASFSLLYGPLAPPAAPDHAPAHAGNAHPAFPHNVVFKQGNYVRREESEAQYDVVLCLSTSKWLHLQHGDAGLKLAFRRMFAELRPGGKLVLEPQSWASYGRRKRLTAHIYSNYNSIELFPHKFRDYLLSAEVGFSRCSVMGVPRHRSRGFRRPLHLYVKGDFTPSKAQWSDAYAPPSSHHRPDAPPPRRTVYAAAPSPTPAAPRTPTLDAAPRSPATPDHRAPAAPATPAASVLPPPHD